MAAAGSRSHRRDSTTTEQIRKREFEPRMGRDGHGWKKWNPATRCEPRQGAFLQNPPPSYPRGIVAFHRLEARLRIGQTPYHAQLITKETEDGTVTRHKFYLHRIK
jgi:hypothetical protein